MGSAITWPGNPRDVLGYPGLKRLRISHPITWPGNPRDILGYLGPKTWDLSPSWGVAGESQGHHGISGTWDLSPYHSAWESQGHLGISGPAWDSKDLGSLSRQRDVI